MPASPTNLFLDDGHLSLSDPTNPDVDPLLAPNRVGILIESLVNRRLIEAATIHIGLVPTLLEEGSLASSLLSDFELIVADELSARTIRVLLSASASSKGRAAPTVIAAYTNRTNEEDDGYKQSEQSYDGVLHLPQLPASLATQLGLMLYAHRAYAIRYRSSIEELHLNRRIFRSLTSGVCVADAMLPDFPLTYVNPAFEVMTGYTLEETRGLNCRFLQGEERDQPGLSLIRQAMIDKREITALIRNYRKNGTAFWNEVTISPILGWEGTITHYVGIQSDVTDRVEYEAKIRESEKLAAVGRLASSIAHEINNPLESVMNLVYIAERTECSEETKHYLAQVDRELRRLKLIASRSLRFYKQLTNAQITDCVELLHSVVALYEARFLNSQIAVEISDTSAIFLICMESEIRQVLNNLLGNAIDAMCGMGGRLRLRVREATDWRSALKGVMFTVADTGPGMSPETIKSLYKAFFTTKGIGGTGLGLWISSEIVERHHGRLLVRSRQDGSRRGTVFTLFLPHPS